MIRLYLIILFILFISSCSGDAKKMENEVKKFCSSIQKGNSYEEVSSKAILIGEEQYRIIRDEAIIVGYTGNLPFPQKLCMIEFINEKVSDTHSYGSK